MPSLTALQILEINDTPLKEVVVPEWGGSVFVRKIRADETERVLRILNAGAAQHTKLVAMACCDENGNALFSDADVEKLNQKSMSAIQTIMKGILDHHPVLMAETAAIEGN